MAVSLEVVFILALTLVNGFFAMTEFALLQANRSRLKGQKGARAVNDLLKEPNRFLSTVQIAITAVGTLAGAMGGATLAEKVGARFNVIEAIHPHGKVLGVIVVWLSISYVALVLGELVPKRLALRNPTQLALKLGGFMKSLAWFFTPLVKLLSFSTNVVLRLLGQEPEQPEEKVTEAEVRDIIAKAAEHGSLKPLEHQLTKRVLLMDDILVEDLMTTSEEIHFLRMEADSEELLETLRAGPHSRYLVHGETVDDIVGVVQTRDLLLRAYSKEEGSLQQLCFPVPRIPSGIDVLDALEAFREHSSSIVVIVDHDDRLKGLLTAQDLLEAIAGRLRKPGAKALS